MQSDLDRRVFEMRCLPGVACVDGDRAFDIVGIDFDQCRVGVRRQQQQSNEPEV